MKADDGADSGKLQSGRGFNTTHWSLVLAAGESDTADAHAALERLCQIYLPPIYSFVRCKGYHRDDAQDLTMMFFERFLARNDLGKADPTRGRFRNFLLKSVVHFLRDEWAKANTEKRGGTHTIVSSDDPRFVEPFLNQSGPGLDPEQAYQRSWAMTVLSQAIQRLREKYVADGGDAALFEALQGHLAGGEQDETYAQLAARFGKKPDAIKTAVNRLRPKLVPMIHSVVKETIANPQELEDELRYLLAIVARR